MLEGYFRGVWPLGPIMALAMVLAAVAPVRAAGPDQWLGALPEGADRLEIGYVEFIPFTYTNAKGRPDGSVLGLAARAARQLGLPWRATSGSAERLIDNMRLGRTHLLMFLRHTDLEPHAIYGSKPVVVIELRAHWLDGREPIAKLADLEGRTVALLRGYSYGGWAKKIRAHTSGVGYNVAETHDKAFDLLERGLVDYVLDYRGPVDDLLTRRRIKGLRHNVVSRIDVFYVVSKRLKDPEGLLQALEQVTARRVE